MLLAITNDRAVRLLRGRRLQQYRATMKVFDSIRDATSMRDPLVSGCDVESLDQRSASNIDGLRCESGAYCYSSNNNQ